MPRIAINGSWHGARISDCVSTNSSCKRCRATLLLERVKLVALHLCGKLIEKDRCLLDCLSSEDHDNSGFQLGRNVVNFLLSLQLLRDQSGQEAPLAKILGGIEQLKAYQENDEVGALQPLVLPGLMISLLLVICHAAGMCSFSLKS